MTDVAALASSIVMAVGVISVYAGAAAKWHVVDARIAATVCWTTMSLTNDHPQRHHAIHCCRAGDCVMLIITPINLDEANTYVTKFHRHHRAVVGHKFCMAVSRVGGLPAGSASMGDICGVCIVGRPVSRNLDNGFTLEVNRVCTDGTKNACSILYGAAWRSVKASPGQSPAYHGTGSCRPPSVNR